MPTPSRGRCVSELPRLRRAERPSDRPADPTWSKSGGGIKIPSRLGGLPPGVYRKPDISSQIGRRGARGERALRMTPEFHRIRRLPPYVLEEVNRIKARLRAEGVDIIDFGMGNPDMQIGRAHV